MTVQQAFREAVKIIESDREKQKMQESKPVLTRNEWLAERRKGIGASEAAAVCGMAAGWGATALEIYLDKIGELPAQPMNTAMKMGLALEPMLSDMYEEATGRKLLIPAPLQHHKDYPFIMANPDRVTEDGKTNTQLKTTAERTDHWGDPGTDAIPEYYVIQVQQEMAVMDLQVTDLAVLFLRSKEFAVYTIPRNEELIASIIEIETEFWQEHVLKRIPPEPDFKHPSTIKLLQTMYPGIADGKVLEVPPESEQEVLDTIAMYKDASTRKSKADTDYKEHKAFLMGIMGDAAQLNVGSKYSVTRKPLHKDAYTVKEQNYVDLRIHDLNKPKKGK